MPTKSITRKFDLYFHDLTEKAQRELCLIFITTPMEENWDVFPLDTLEREFEVDSEG
jgi:hypothetical protein